MNEVVPISSAPPVPDTVSPLPIAATATEATCDPDRSPVPASAEHPGEDRCVWVCQHRTCMRHGAAGVMAAFAAVAVPGVTVRASGCLGQCSIGPNARVLPDEIWYAHLTPADIEPIVAEHLCGGQPVDRLLNPRIHKQFG